MYKKILYKYAIIILLIGLFSSCKTNPTAQDEYGLAAPLDSLLAPVFPSDAPGVVVIVAKGDTILYDKSFGLARLDSVMPMSDDILLNVSSSTKTFTAAAILKLAEEGKLSLDDKLVKYFPNFPENVLGSITLRQVLGHTSGIPDERPRTHAQWEKYLKDNTSIFGYGPDYCIYGREAELTRYLEKLDTLSFEPGTRFERQDPPYMLLSTVIEQASGIPFEKWMQQYIFDPAGVKSATFIRPDMPMGRTAHGYAQAEGCQKPKIFRSANGRWDEYDYGEAFFFLTKADRGLYITPLDFVKLQNALFSGKLISEESLALFRTPIISSDKLGEGCSLGINVSEDCNGRIKLFHRSMRGGFFALEAYYPDNGVMYLLFSNRNDWNPESMQTAFEKVLCDKNII